MLAEKIHNYLLAYKDHKRIFSSSVFSIDDLNKAREKQNKLDDEWYYFAADNYREYKNSLCDYIIKVCECHYSVEISLKQVEKDIAILMMRN